MIVNSALLAFLTIAVRNPAVTNPADIHHAGTGRWRLIHVVPQLAHLRYNGVEVLFAEPLSTVPVVTMEQSTLQTRIDYDASYLLATSEFPFGGDGVTLQSREKPIQAAFVFAEPHARGLREPFVPLEPHSWRFIGPMPLPEPWELCSPSTRVSDSDSLPYLVMRTGSSHGIRTKQQWRGGPSSRFPVMVVQMQINSGVGTGTLLWETTEARHGSWTFQIPRRGEWEQLVLPLIRHPLWRGGIRRLELVPATHATIARLDWIQFPQVSSIWATLLATPSARWLLWIALFVLFAAVLRFAYVESCFKALLGGVVVSCAIVPLVLPFGELRPAVRLGTVGIPAFVPLLALIALMRRPLLGKAVDRAAWLCVAVTLGLGIVVAQGAGMESAVRLIALPLAFLAGREVVQRGIGHGVTFLIAATTALFCIHAMVFPFAPRDPVYGGVLSSLGRAYSDPTVFGRSSGAFVHPLVLATGALTLGAVTSSTRIANKWPSLTVVGILLVGGILSGSRVFLLLVGLTVVVFLRKRIRYAALASLLAISAVFVYVASAPDAQSLLRGVHLDKRITGFEVTKNTLAAKPLQGVGWGKYRRAVWRFGSPMAKIVPFTTPDSSLARFFAEGGFLGGTVWVGWFAMLFYASRRSTSASLLPLPSWLPSLFFIVMVTTFDGAYWEAACLPACAALGSTIE